MLRALATVPDLGLRPVGFVDDDPHLVGQSAHGLPVLGQGRELDGIVDQNGIRTLVSTNGQVRTPWSRYAEIECLPSITERTINCFPMAIR
jgi:FlaA1/EpsC-like NDP-sugar epimerase